MREYKEMYKYEQYKRRSRVYRRKTRETRREAWKDRASDGLLEIHATATLLRSVTGRIHKLQLRDLDIRIQGSQNSSASGDANAKWRIDKHTCIDKSES